MDFHPAPGRRLYIVRWMTAGALFGAFFPLLAWRVAVADAGPLTFSELHQAFPMMWIVDLAPTVLGLVGGVIGLLYSRLAESKAQTEDTARQIAANWTAELHHANLELANRLKTRRNFYAAVTHELRTPLTAIVGYADVAEELAYEPPELTSYISEIYGSATALLHMVNDLLDASKLEASGIAIEMGRVSCREAVADVVGQMMPLATQKGLSLSAPVGVDIECWADPTRLRQVMTNVVANAIKYSDSGAIDLTVGESNGAPIIEVKDQGVGIDADSLASIFDPFDSGSSGDGRRDSSGLGLTISRSLLEAMDGTITAHSDGPGCGSTFRMTLGASDSQQPESRTASLASLHG